MGQSDSWAMQAAATVCYVATHPKMEGLSGKYFVDCSEAKCSALANDEAQARQLWNFSEHLTSMQTNYMCSSFGSMMKVVSHNESSYDICR